MMSSMGRPDAGPALVIETPRGSNITGKVGWKLAILYAMITEGHIIPCHVDLQAYKPANQ